MIDIFKYYGKLEKNAKEVQAWKVTQRLFPSSVSANVFHKEKVTLLIIDTLIELIKEFFIFSLKVHWFVLTYI